MPLIILSELTLMSIIFNAFISRGKKSTFFASKRVKQLYSLSMKGKSPCCWVCSNSEPETSSQSLGQKEGKWPVAIKESQDSGWPVFRSSHDHLPMAGTWENSAGRRAGGLTFPHTGSYANWVLPPG